MSLDSHTSLHPKLQTLLFGNSLPGDVDLPYPRELKNQNGHTTHIQVNERITLLCFPQDSIDKMRAYYVQNIALPEKALSEIKTYQDTLDRESKGIPTSERIQGNVKYFLRKIL